MTILGEPTGTIEWSVDGEQFDVEWAMVTDVGHKREINEDSAVVAAPVFAVADGMGGHEAGEVASKCVVERLSELGNQRVGEDEVVTALRGAVADLVDSGVDSGSGTTVTGIVLNDVVPEAEVFNVGDSRVYLFRNDVVVQITKDHSVVQELIDAGQLSVDDAETHPHSNVITRAVGLYDDPVPDFVRIGVQTGDRLLICTDGLTKELTHYGISHYMNAETEPQAVANALLNAALENGGRDNVTMIVLSFIARAA